MKKILFGLFLCNCFLIAEVTKIIPYIGMVSYDKNLNESVKDYTKFSGVYYNTGTLDYLMELNYAFTNTIYKTDQNIDDLQQHDITFTYAKYFKEFMFRLGIHYISTNEKYLGDATILISGFGGYKFINFDKLSYGVEGYYSSYENTIRETADSQNLVKMKIIQLVPYISYFKSLNEVSSNNINIKLNYQTSQNTKQNKYISYEISNIFYYKSVYLEGYIYNGEMKSGVKNGGFIVYNSLDLQKNGFGIKFGYYLKSDLIIGVNYSLDNFVEVDLTQETKSSTLSLNLNYWY